MKSNNFSQLSAWAELGNSGLRWWQYGTSKASPYKNDRGPIFHSAARASDVCNYFISWHSERLSLLSVAFEKKIHGVDGFRGNSTYGKIATK